MTMFIRKAIIALSGLFLCLFLVVHLSVNCILLLPEDTARGMYNAYSTWLRENPLIKLVAYVLYLALLAHIIYSVVIVVRNYRAKPVKYAMNRTQENSTWTSQNMGLLGLLVLIFLVVHLANFWSPIKLGLGGELAKDELGNLDVYQVAYTLFQNIYYVGFYTLLVVPLGFHLHHGLKSAFKTLGFYHRRGLRILAKVSLAYAACISVGFGLIPIVVYFK
ncbi:MAG: succinate dehydrogenase cytochrome b subunit [Bacteroidia bacterium]|nr:succinate dehydrogenase cytochrome b subunit [Bacteroidia bacterium]